jgi:hypothetical protein
MVSGPLSQRNFFLLVLVVFLDCRLSKVSNIEFHGLVNDLIIIVHGFVFCFPSMSAFEIHEYRSMKTISNPVGMRLVELSVTPSGKISGRIHSNSQKVKKCRSWYSHFESMRD